MIRVLWKYQPSVIGLWHEAAPDPQEMQAFNENLLDGFEPVSGAKPIFSMPDTAVRADAFALNEEMADGGVEPVDLAGYNHAFVESEDEARALVDRLQQDSDISWASYQAPLLRPVWRDSTAERRRPQAGELTLPMAEVDDFTGQQGHLNPSPAGVGAQHAWGVPGGRGDGIRIFDLEVGWDLDHEDLRRNLVGVVHGANKSEDHGTAVLGILGADHNGKGVSGIAPGAHCAVAGVAWGPGPGGEWQWNPEDAIHYLLRSAPRGSVVLLELQGAWPGTNDLVAIEAWQSTFDVLSLATRRGLVVVEAAGNGTNNENGVDLDRAAFGNIFNRGVTDSGAILVGSGDPTDRSRVTHSNFGSRVDVHAWGSDIVTCGGKREAGYDDLRTDPLTSRCYTKSFGGTSGASAIVAGVAACIQGARKAQGRPLLDSRQLRDVLARTGAAQLDGQHPATENIGPRPDLLAALSEVLG